MSNLRKGRVALSILGVKGHNMDYTQALNCLTSLVLFLHTVWGEHVCLKHSNLIPSLRKSFRLHVKTTTNMPMCHKSPKKLAPTAMSGSSIPLIQWLCLIDTQDLDNFLEPQNIAGIFLGLRDGPLAPQFELAV